MKRSTTFPPGKTKHHPHEDGFTLLEVLIAMLILSVGLLGLAALQGVGLRSSNGAYLTSQASLLAYDIADRIRTNADEFSTHSLTFNCPGTTTSLANSDMGEWSCAIERILPRGSATLTRIPVPAEGRTRYDIEINWEDLQTQGQEWSFELAIDVDLTGSEPELLPPAP